MQKIIITVVVAIIAVIGLVWLLSDTTLAPKEASNNEQVRIIAGEVIAIEAELAGLAASTETGTFTPTAAQATKASLSAKLASLESAFAINNTAEMSSEEKSGLVISADTMKILFGRYQNTLVAIDSTAGGQEDILSFESLTKRFIKTTNELSDEASSIVREYKYQEITPNAATQMYLDGIDEARDSAENNRKMQQASSTENTATTSVSGSTTLEMAI